MKNPSAAVPSPADPVRRTLRLRKETVEHLRDDLFNLQAESLWTCPGDRIPREDPGPAYVEIDGVRVEVHIDVRDSSRDQG